MNPYQQHSYAPPYGPSSIAGMASTQMPSVISRPPMPARSFPVPLPGMLMSPPMVPPAMQYLSPAMKPPMVMGGMYGGPLLPSHSLMPGSFPPPPPGMIPTISVSNTTIQSPPVLAPKSLETQSTTVYVGKIAPGIEDDFVKKLLEQCGKIVHWKRVADPSTGKLKAFGFCEYESPEGAIRSLRILSNFSLGGQPLLLKVDEKTQKLIEEFEVRRNNFGSESQLSSSEMKPNGNTNEKKDASAEINEKLEKEVRLQNEEEDLRVKDIIEQLIERRDKGLEWRNLDIDAARLDAQLKRERAKKEEIAESLAAASIEADDEKVDIVSREIKSFREKEAQRDIEKEERKLELEEAEKLRLEKANEREREREREQYRKEKDEKQFREREREWELREAMKEKEKEKENERNKRPTKSRAVLDLEYLESNDPHSNNSNSASYNNSGNDSNASHRRRRERERERLEDEEDRNMELKEKELAKKRRLEEERARDRRQRQQQQEQQQEVGAEEILEEAARLRKEMQLQYQRSSNGLSPSFSVSSPSLSVSPSFTPSSLLMTMGSDEHNNNNNNNNSNIDPLKESEGGPSNGSSIRLTGMKFGALPIEKKRPVSVVPGFNAEPEVDELFTKKKRRLVTLETALHQENERKVKMEIAKNLIEKIPTEKDKVFAYAIDWQLIESNNIVETKLRPWISKKMVEYLGEEEKTLIDFIISKICGHITPNELLEQLVMVLDEEAEIFVLKLWRMLIFEMLSAGSN